MRRSLPVFVAAAVAASSCRCRTPEAPPPPIVFEHHLRCSLTLPPGFVAGSPMPDHLFEALLLGDGAVRTLAVKEAGTVSADDAASSLVEAMKASRPELHLARRTAVDRGVLLVFESGSPAQHELWFVGSHHGRAVKAWTGLQDPSLDAEAEAALTSLACTPR